MNDLNTLKKNTYYAVIMLVAAGLALASATYAWFVNNTAVSVEEMNFTASAANAMEIAVHVDGATTANQAPLEYKGKLESEDVAPYIAKLMTVKVGGIDKRALKAVSTVSMGAFYTMGSYDGDTRMAVGYWKLDPDEPKDQYYLKVPVWIRATTDVDIYLGDKTEVTTTAIDNNKYFTRTLRLGFQDIAGDGTTVTKATIYEPNAETIGHNERKNTTKDLPDATDRWGITAVDAAGAATFAEQVRYDDTGMAITAGTNAIAPAPAGKEKIATLTANVPKKIIIYIWMDGVDFDCVDSVTGSLADVNIEFAAAVKKP